MRLDYLTNQSTLFEILTNRNEPKGLKVAKTDQMDNRHMTSRLALLLIKFVLAKYYKD